MLEVHGNRLVFTFPEVHPEAKLEIEFQRTLRIPDDDKTYPLPPGLGTFPVKHVGDFKANLSEDTVKRGGVMIPMYQSEALWIRFSAGYVQGHGAYPFAVKIAAGKRSAVTGKEWAENLNEKDYIVSPAQPWIDGFVVSEGTIRQFVAAPLGMGFTVEEQLTGKAEFGGMQIEVFPMLRAEFDKRFPKQEYATRGLMRGLSLESMASGAPMRAAKSASMGMAAGGKMKQTIKADPYGLEVWDTTRRSRTFVHLMNSLTWKQVTGQAPPTVPPTAKEYAQNGLPWFEHYSDGPNLGNTSETDKIKSVAQLGEEKGFTVYPDNESVNVDPSKVVGIKGNPNSVKDGTW